MFHPFNTDFFCTLGFKHINPIRELWLRELQGFKITRSCERNAQTNCIIGKHSIGIQTCANLKITHCSIKLPRPGFRQTSYIYLNGIGEKVFCRFSIGPKERIIEKWIVKATVASLIRFNLYFQLLSLTGPPQFSEIQGLRIIGEAPNKGSIISFVLDGIHPHDVGTIMDMEGVAVRTGHHCTQPVMEHYDIPATTRVSLSFYNTVDEIDEITRAINKVKELMG